MEYQMGKTIYLDDDMVSTPIFQHPVDCAVPRTRGFISRCFSKVRSAYGQGGFPNPRFRTPAPVRRSNTRVLRKRRKEYERTNGMNGFQSVLSLCWSAARAVCANLYPFAVLCCTLLSPPPSTTRPGTRLTPEHNGDSGSHHPSYALLRGTRTPCVPSYPPLFTYHPPRKAQNQTPEHTARFRKRNARGFLNFYLRFE